MRVVVTHFPLCERKYKRVGSHLNPPGWGLPADKVKAKIVHLTKIKRQLLENEYENLQRFLHDESAELYSANKQQAKRFYEMWKFKHRRQEKAFQI